MMEQDARCSCRHVSHSRVGCRNSPIHEKVKGAKDAQGSLVTKTHEGEVHQQALQAPTHRPSSTPRTQRNGLLAIPEAFLRDPCPVLPECPVTGYVQKISDARKRKPRPDKTTMLAKMMTVVNADEFQNPFRTRFFVRKNAYTVYYFEKIWSKKKRQLQICIFLCFSSSCSFFSFLSGLTLARSWWAVGRAHTQVFTLSWR